MVLTGGDLRDAVGVFEDPTKSIPGDYWALRRQYFAKAGTFLGGGAHGKGRVVAAVASAFFCFEGLRLQTKKHVSNSLFHLPTPTEEQFEANKNNKT